MDFATFDPLTASDNDLITWCEKASFIHGGECFEGLVQPASHVVIKVGSSVMEQEARNQSYAYEQLKDRNLQVPQVYRYFLSKQDSIRKGYLVMEHIPGRTMAECMTGRNGDEVYQMYAQCIFEAANTLSKAAVPPLQPPGPVGGGEPYGYLFHEDGVGCRAKFGSIQLMNSWLNKRLRLAQDPSSKIRKYIGIHEQAISGILDFQDTELTLVHGDLTPRNFIVVKNNNRLALVDWAFAGFYLKALKLLVV